MLSQKTFLCLILLITSIIKPSENHLSKDSVKYALTAILGSPNEQRFIQTVWKRTNDSYEQTTTFHDEEPITQRRISSSEPSNITSIFPFYAANGVDATAHNIQIMLFGLAENQPQITPLLGEIMDVVQGRKPGRIYWENGQLKCNTTE